MNRFLIALALTIVLALVSLIGAASRQPLLLVMAFLLWTPTAWFTGYTFAKAGGRVRSPVDLDRERSPKRQQGTEFS